MFWLDPQGASRGGAQPVMLTRLHLRYTKESLPEDLVFQMANAQLARAYGLKSMVGTFATGSSDTAGSVTLGTTPASGFIITFNGTWAAAPVCTVSLPVFFAHGISDVVVWNAAPIEQPRPQGEAQ